MAFKRSAVRSCLSPPRDRKLNSFRYFPELFDIILWLDALARSLEFFCNLKHALLVLDDGYTSNLEWTSQGSWVHGKLWDQIEAVVTCYKPGSPRIARHATEKITGTKAGIVTWCLWFFLDISDLSHYNFIRIFDCHRVVSESACLHIVRS